MVQSGWSREGGNMDELLMCLKMSLLHRDIKEKLCLWGAYLGV